MEKDPDARAISFGHLGKGQGSFEVNERFGDFHYKMKSI